MNKFIGHSQVVSTNNYNTLKITVTITQNKVLNVLLASRCLVTSLIWLTLQLLNCLLNSLTYTLVCV
jgi:hypothetical protein